MLQYILNLTAIWLLSLLAFELFLKRETYHAYNRIYLLSTFLMGIFLPLWSWNVDAQLMPGASTEQVQKLVAAKQNLVVATQHASLNVSWQQILWYGYFAGALVSLCLVIFGIAKIIALYQVGVKYKEGRWTVVETVKGHAPFSIFHILFVDSREQYTTEQWQIILDHEEKHASLQHLVDQLIMQAGRVIFWFHPLAYVYNKRLMLLHEYQADKIGGSQPAVYGRFLVEQAMLHTAPKLAHSFNRSPIKMRMVMLTRSSSFLRKTKALLFIPLIFICAICFSKNKFSNKIEKIGNIATYRGNKFEFTPEMPKDTVTVVDPTTGEQRMMVTERVPRPVKMNEEKIYNNDDLTGKTNGMGSPANNEPGFNADNIKEYLLTNLAPELEDAPDGVYVMHLINIIIDKDGRITYFEYGGIKPYKHGLGEKGTASPEFKKELQDKITNRVYDLLNNAPPHNPASIDGKEVPFYLVHDGVFWNSFVIKKGKIVSM